MGHFSENPDYRRIITKKNLRQKTYNQVFCLIFLHRFYIPVGKTLQSAAIMKNVEMRKKEIKHIKKRK